MKTLNKTTFINIVALGLHNYLKAFIAFFCVLGLIYTVVYINPFGFDLANFSDIFTLNFGSNASSILFDIKLQLWPLLMLNVLPIKPEEIQSHKGFTDSEQEQTSLSKTRLRLSKAERDAFNLSSEQTEILIGLFLGDLNACKQKGGVNVRLQFVQGLIHKDYLLHLFDLFKDFCNTGKGTFITNNKPDKRTGETYNLIRFTTFSLPCFNKLYELFYSDGKKVVPLNVDSMLTPLSLAYWIADDGTFQKSHSIVILCTDSFALEQVTLLMNILNEKWNLQCYIIKVNKNGSYRIYIPRKSLPILQSLLKDIMPPMMLHKIGL